MGQKYFEGKKIKDMLLEKMEEITFLHWWKDNSESEIEKGENNDRYNRKRYQG